MRVLFVKMSSLGDVVHALPAVTDLAATGAEIDWVVEEAFAPIAAAHPAVARVLPIAWRRWRKALPRFWDSASAEARTAFRAFRRELKSSAYDLVIDAQGLYKSAMVVRMVPAARTVGFDRSSAREGGAAAFYSEPVSVPREQHAIDRVRQLVAAAVAGTVPGALDFGLAPSADLPAGPPRCLLLHGTTWNSKHYPEAQWRALAQRAADEGFEVCATWGDAAEQARAERLAAAAPITLWDRQPLEELMARLSTVALVIGVDSGIAHLSAALGVPTLGLYGPTDAVRTGIRGARANNLAAPFDCAPCLKRECEYRGPSVAADGATAVPACFGQLPAATVWQAARALVAR